MRGHIFMAGVTGSGKSYTEELIIKHLQSQDIDMVICDPKGTELMFYENAKNVVRYEAEEDGILRALQFAKVTMDCRFREMRQKREREYSGKTLYVIIDEAGWISDISSKQDRMEALDALYAIAFRGRAAKVFLLLATQRGTADVLPRKITINCDVKICLRQDKPRDSYEIIGITDACKLPKIGWCYLKIPNYEGKARKIWVDDIIQHLEEN